MGCAQTSSRDLSDLKGWFSVASYQSFYNEIVRWTKIAILLMAIFAVRLTTAQVTSSGESGATLSDREKEGLRGPVKSWTVESAFPGMTDAEGKPSPEVHWESTTEYDTAGRLLATFHKNSDGSQWGTHYSYDPSGRLLKTASGVEGQAPIETNYSYDHQGRLQMISESDKPETAITFSYDEQGRKSKIAISRPADYRANVATGGSPFESVEMAPNLPGGGTATTIYDEHDRATEVQVRDASGEIVNRAVRTYDAQGHLVEEKQIMDNPASMVPEEMRAQMLEQSGLSRDQLQEELRTQLRKLMGGHSGLYSISYSYDDHGRVTRANRRIFNEGQEIETTYNDHGDTASQITRSTGLSGAPDATTPAPRLPDYSEARYSYKYDRRGNWIEKAISFRSSPDAGFQSSTLTKRTLTYYQSG
jgi:YD repeat-containing protein